MSKKSVTMKNGERYWIDEDSNGNCTVTSQSAGGKRVGKTNSVSSALQLIVATSGSDVRDIREISG